MKARLKKSDGSFLTVDVKTKESDGVLSAYLEKDIVGNDTEYVDFLYDYFTAKVGDDGYFVTDMTNDGTAVTFFTPREDYETVRSFSFLSCYGMNKGNGGVLAIVKGMKYDFGTVLGIKDGVYYTFPRFYTDCDEMYEDIQVDLYGLEGGTYSDMAVKYREYMMNECGCESLKVRTARDSRLAKAADSIEIRVRQGWKPAPSPVEDQTPETEPPMHVACTFDRVGDIAEAFKNENIRNAEFCLVGWNYGGHDGRFPQLLPVDPRLGGEERLRSLIDKVHNSGYGIVCHDDATAAYKIADCFDEEYLLKNKDMSLHKRPYRWSGGRPYKVCPRRQYERFEISNQELIKNLGFEGIHYIDVITILPLLKCYDKNHPLTRAQSAEQYIKIMKLSRENFGGFSSESGFDFGARYTDYVMYPSFSLGKDEKPPMCDEIIPFWHIVYHGIILYNPCTYTLNYPAKGEKNRLKCIELGGRPLICYYANFAGDQAWMGREDFLCDTDEELSDTAKKAKLMEEDYDLLRDERYEFIVNHEKLGDSTYRTTYSNGTKVTVNYENETFEISRNGK